MLLNNWLFITYLSKMGNWNPQNTCASSHQFKKQNLEDKHLICMLFHSLLLRVKTRARCSALPAQCLAASAASWLQGPSGDLLLFTHSHGLNNRSKEVFLVNFCPYSTSQHSHEPDSSFLTEHFLKDNKIRRS